MLAYYSWQAHRCRKSDLLYARRLGVWSNTLCTKSTGSFQATRILLCWRTNVQLRTCDCVTLGAEHRCTDATLKRCTDGCRTCNHAAVEPCHPPASPPAAAAAARGDRTQRPNSCRRGRRFLAAPVLRLDVAVSVAQDPKDSRLSLEACGDARTSLTNVVYRGPLPHFR